LTVFLLYLQYMWGRKGWLKASYGGVAKNVRVPSYGERESKSAQKTVV